MLGLLTAALLAPALLAQPDTPSATPPDPPPGPPAFKPLRYDEDFSALKDPARRTDFWDPVKFIPLTDHASLSFGGEARWRYEAYRNARWNPDAPDQDGYLLQRYLLHADLRLGDSFRAFAQLQSSLEDWRAGGPRATDQNRADLHQLFADLRLWHDDDHDAATLRLGRQEILLGSQRLVSVRDSPNIRRAFDAARLLTTFGPVKLDAFIARPVEDDPGPFDDSGHGHTNFWGFYATLPAFDHASLDLYYLGLRRPDARFVQGTGDELRHSWGARLFAPGPRDGGLDYNLEAVLQLGRFAGADIRAWTLASDLGYTFGGPLAPRAGLRADLVSGDQDPDHPRLGTFNPLFPRGAYFGEISLIGPANILDLHPSLELHPAKSLKLSADWDFFWRASADDGLYDSGGNVLRRPGPSRAAFVGHQPGLSIEWSISRHQTLSASYAHFFAGDFIRQSGPAKDVDFLALWLVHRF